jgi:hypothetical protein
MGDPVLFWTLFAVIAANIIVLVLAFIAADRESDREGRKFTTDDEHSSRRG